MKTHGVPDYKTGCRTSFCGFARVVDTMFISASSFCLFYSPPQSQFCYLPFRSSAAGSCAVRTHSTRLPQLRAWVEQSGRDDDSAFLLSPTIHLLICATSLILTLFPHSHLDARGIAFRLVHSPGRYIEEHYRPVVHINRFLRTYTRAHTPLTS